MAEIPTFQCVLLGDGGTGKTTYIKTMLTGVFDPAYTATMGYHLYPIVFPTNRGLIRFDVRDTVGQEAAGKLRDQLYKCSECAIIIFDLSSRISFKNVLQWQKSFDSVSPNKHICVVGNKTDLDHRKVLWKAVMRRKKESTLYVETSAKTNTNLLKPFLHFARQLMDDQTLELTGSPTLVRSENGMDDERIGDPNPNKAAKK